MNRQEIEERKVNLWGADLRYANLRDANLQDANLRYANLWGADLRYANLRYANLQDADLQDANLWGANLWGADLRGANLDMSVFPLWCGSFNMKVDERLVFQLIAHITRLDTNLPGKARHALAALHPFRNEFCRYRDDVEEI